MLTAAKVAGIGVEMEEALGVSDMTPERQHTHTQAYMHTRRRDRDTESKPASELAQNPFQHHGQNTRASLIGALAPVPHPHPACCRTLGH